MSDTPDESVELQLSDDQIALINKIHDHQKLIGDSLNEKKDDIVKRTEEIAKEILGDLEHFQISELQLNGTNVIVTFYFSKKHGEYNLRGQNQIMIDSAEFVPDLKEVIEECRSGHGEITKMAEEHGPALQTALLKYEQEKLSAETDDGDVE